MTSRDSDNQQMADEDALLLFLANGTLAGDERDAVERAVAKSARLQAQLHVLKAMRTDLRSSPMTESPGANGLARLLADLNDVPMHRNRRSGYAMTYLKWAALILIIVLFWRPTSCSFAGVSSNPKTAMVANALSAISQELR